MIPTDILRWKFYPFLSEPGSAQFAKDTVKQSGIRAEGMNVWGKAQYPRVKASQGVYWSGFIHPNKQTKVELL